MIKATEKTKKNVAVKEQESTREIQPFLNREISPVEMIRTAVSGGASLEQLEKFIELQERFDANQAKKAYVQAVASFKCEAPLVTKDKTNKQYNSKYTSLSNLINTVNPVLSKHGLSASWDIIQNGNIKVICKLTHALGHSDQASMLADPDTSGAKSKIQQLKSTITYLKAVTFESICGLASSDANFDDDGEATREQPRQASRTTQPAPQKEQRFAPPPETTQEPETVDAEFKEEKSEFISQEELSGLIAVAIKNKWMPDAIEKQFSNLGYKITSKITKSLKLESFVDPVNRWDYESLLETVSKLMPKTEVKNAAKK